LLFVVDRAGAQVVSRRRPEFQSGASHMGFVVYKVQLGQVLSEYFGFPCAHSFHRLLHNRHHNLPSRAGKIEQ
jgi:hypothetical protein